MDKSVKCPGCSGKVLSKHFKTWKFGPYEVKRYECEHCKSKFNLYRSAGRTFTIPKSK